MAIALYLVMTNSNQTVSTLTLANGTVIVATWDRSLADVFSTIFDAFHPAYADRTEEGFGENFPADTISARIRRWHAKR